ALGGADRPGLHHTYAVTNRGAVFFVVRLEPARMTNHLAVEAVLYAVLDRDDNRLVHLVADHIAFADLASPPLCGGRIGTPPLCGGRIGTPPLCGGRIGTPPLCGGRIGTLPLYVGYVSHLLAHSSTSSASGSSMMPSSRSVNTV